MPVKKSVHPKQFCSCTIAHGCTMSFAKSYLQILGIVLGEPSLVGIYLHSLAVHAPMQYELVCLRSVNTENQERIFQQAKHIARTTTNRQPGNVIPTLLLRLQAKQLNGQLLSSMDCGESRVKRVAATVSSFSGTMVSEDFIRSRSRSWQTHLE